MAHVKKKPLYFNDAELQIISSALDDLDFLDGQTHEYTDEQIKNHSAAYSKIIHEQYKRSKNEKDTNS